MNMVDFEAMGWRKLTAEEQDGIREFERVMKEETIPAIVQTIRRRNELANEYRGILY